jgi:hypothetical protein
VENKRPTHAQFVVRPDFLRMWWCLSRWLVFDD